MQVLPPSRIATPPRELGRLGDALGWLARAQGAWPPHVPRHPQRVDVAEGGGLAAGIAAADRLADTGGDLLVLDGGAATTAAFAVLCVLLDLEPVTVLGTTGSPGWAERVVAVRDRLPGLRACVGDPEALAEDALLGHVVGLLAQSAVRRTPVILGSSVLLAAAALVADRLAPGARAWWLAAARPHDACIRRVHAALQLDPLLDLGLQVPGGAAIALDVLTRGVEIAERCGGQPGAPAAD